MIKLLWDIVSCVGMITYLAGLVMVFFRVMVMTNFLIKHPIIKSIFGILVMIGFIRFAFAISSLI